MKLLKLLVTITAIFAAESAIGGIHHDAYHSFAPFAGCADGDCLIVENTSGERAFSLDTVRWSIGGEFEVRIANLNNKENSTYHYTDDKGVRHSVVNPEWGVVWNYTDSANYDAVVLRSVGGGNYDDIAGKREVEVSLERCSGGKITVVNKVLLEKRVDVATGFNSVKVDIDNGVLTVKIGKYVLVPVFDGVESASRGVCGVMAGSGAKVAIKSVYVDVASDPDNGYSTSWTESSLREYFKQGCDPVEGFWKYLDRRTPGVSVQSGGEYRIAVVKNATGGYDIIYLSGARINGTKWHPGLIKGVLEPSGFVNNYRLTWRDTEKNLLNDDTNANLLMNAILEINFPALKSTLRFSRDE